MNLLRMGVGIFCISGFCDDMQTISGASQRWRRTNAIASVKVGKDLAYHAVGRGLMGCSSCNTSAARVIHENSPNSTGVVRAMARSDHWR